MLGGGQSPVRGTGHSLNLASHTRVRQELSPSLTTGQRYPNTPHTGRQHSDTEPDTSDVSEDQLGSAPLFEPNASPVSSDIYIFKKKNEMSDANRHRGLHSMTRYPETVSHTVGQ